MAASGADNGHGAFYRVAWLAIAIVVVIGMVFVFAPQVTRHRRWLAEKEAKEAEQQALEASITDLRERQEQFRTNPRFVERTAREVGMVKPDEVLLKDERTPGETPR